MAKKKRKRCQKKAYASKTEATTAMQAMLAKFKSVVYKKVYKCPDCRKWHVTSKPHPRGPRRVKR